MPRLGFLFFLLGTIAARADVIIGVSAPLGGASQQLGQELVGGVKAAVAAVNDSGGFDGEFGQVVVVDDGCDFARASDAAQKLIAQQVNVVIGSLCSSASLGLAPLLEKAGITLIVPNASMPAVTEGGISNVLRIGPRSDAQGAFAARRILAKRPGAHLAVVDDGTPQMKQTVAAFAAAFGKDVGLALTVPPGTSDFAATVDKAKAAGIDTIYLAQQANDAGRLVAALAAAGLNPKRYGPDNLLDDAFWRSAGAAGESTLVSFPADPQEEPGARALARALKAGGGDPAGPALASYAAVQLYAGAGQPHGGLQIATELKSGHAFTTVLGPLRFDTKGDLQDLRFAWYSWNNGQYQTIAPEQP